MFQSRDRSPRLEWRAVLMLSLDYSWITRNPEVCRGDAELISEAYCLGNDVGHYRPQSVRSHCSTLLQCSLSSCEIGEDNGAPSCGGEGRAASLERDRQLQGPKDWI